MDQRELLEEKLTKLQGTYRNDPDMQTVTWGGVKGIDGDNPYHIGQDDVTRLLAIAGVSKGFADACEMVTGDSTNIYQSEAAKIIHLGLLTGKKLEIKSLEEMRQYLLDCQ